MDQPDARQLAALVGLGLRARNVVVGVEPVRAAARRGTVQLALVASDASRHTLDKVVPLLRARGVQMVNGLGVTTLGAAVGREAVAVIGVLDAQLAHGIRRIVDRSG